MLMLGLKLDVVHKANLFMFLVALVAAISAAQCVMQLGTKTYLEAVIMEAISAVMELCECEYRGRNDMSHPQPHLT